MTMHLPAILQRRTAPARQPLRSGRHGVVVKVLRGDPNPRYEIKWDEGVTTVFSPSGASLHADDNYVTPEHLKQH